MNAVTKYRKRPLFRIISTCVLALLAGLVLAPGFGASAKTGPLLTGGKNTVEGKNAVDTRPAAQPTVIPHHRSDQTSAPGGEEQAPVAQPEQNGEPAGFEEETTFAIGEPAEQHGYGYHDAPGFAALGAPAFSGSGGGAAKPKHQPQLAAGNPTQNPHGSDGDTTPGTTPATTPGDTSATSPSDQPDGNPHDDTNPNGLPVASVPEPSSIALLAIGLLGLAFARRYS